MNPSVLFVFILSILLGVLRAADLAFGTDAVTGLCVVGSVWWRYLALGIVVLAAVLVGRTQPSHSEAVRSRRPLAGILAFVGAVCFLAAAGAQIALGNLLHNITKKSVRINLVSWVVIATMKQTLKSFGLITMVFRMIILADGIILALVLL